MLIILHIVGSVALIYSLMGLVWMILSYHQKSKIPIDLQK